MGKEYNKTYFINRNMHSFVESSVYTQKKYCGSYF